MRQFILYNTVRCEPFSWLLTRMKHVLIIVENLPAPPDYRVWRIATTLRAAGWRVSVISPATASWPAGEFEIEGIAVFRHWMPCEARRLAGYLVEYAVAVVQELRLSITVFRRARFQVIHACNPPDLIWLVALFWRLFGVKFVYDHHDLCPELVLAKAGVQSPADLGLVHRVLFRLMLAMERVSHWLADVVLATNESYQAVALGRNRCVPERVFTVKTAPTEAELAEGAARTGAVEIADRGTVPQSGIEGGAALRIGYVGVMARQDGVDGLLRIARRLRTDLKKEFELVLVGDGPERAALGKMATELGLEPVTRFCGFLPRAAMMAEAQAFAIGVTPDPPGPMNNASTMLKVVDYMACGVAQVMYDLPENRATAQDAAVYATAGDEEAFAAALAGLLDDGAAREALAARGRARVRTLAWERNGAVALGNAYGALGLQRR